MTRLFLRMVTLGLDCKLLSIVVMIFDNPPYNI